MCTDYPNKDVIKVIEKRLSDGEDDLMTNGEVQ